MSKSREALIKQLNQLHEQLDNLPPEIVDRLANGNPPGGKYETGEVIQRLAIVCDATSKLYEVTTGAMAFKIDGKGNKYLADDGVYHEINVDTTEITNKLNTLTSDVNTLKTDVANLKTEVNGASAALTELEEASNSPLTRRS